MVSTDSATSSEGDATRRKSSGRRPRLSVVVPVLDGGKSFRLLLEALLQSSGPPLELIVVDDGSRDDSAQHARGAGALVLHTAGGEGPAAARNLGAARATGDVLVFVDADCVPHADTLAKISARFAEDPDLAALFGSYDDRPAAPGLVAQYKNLQHHWVHQRGRAEAETFWSGCGAIRREIFEQVGGFHAGRFPQPSIEDIELGARLRRAGHRILLAPDIQVTHHKAWTLSSVIRTDVWHRGVPWTKLLLSGEGASRDLNLDWTGKLSALAATLLVASLLALPIVKLPVWVAIVSAVVLLALGFGFYRFVASVRGLRSALLAVPLHWLYHLCCSAAFVLGVAGWLREGRRPAAAFAASSPEGAGASLDSSDHAGLPEELAGAFAHYDPIALGGAVGVVAGCGGFLATAVLLLGPEPFGPTLALLGNYLPGFDVTWGGALIGASELAALGFAFGWFGARLFNVLIDLTFARLMRELDGVLETADDASV